MANLTAEQRAALARRIEAVRAGQRAVHGIHCPQYCVKCRDWNEYLKAVDIETVAALLADLAAAEAERDRLAARVEQLGQAVEAGMEERDGLAQQVARLEHEARGVADEREAERLVRDQAHVMLGQISGIVQPGDGELLVPAVRRLADQEADHHERLWNLARAVLGPVRDEGWWRPGPGHSVSCSLCDNAADEQAGAGAIVHDVDCAVPMARAFLARVTGDAT